MAVMDDLVSEPSNIVGVSSTGEGVASTSSSSPQALHMESQVIKELNVSV